MGVEIRYFGHAYVHLTVGGYRVAIDPFVEGNPLAPPEARHVAADYVLLTHGHGDHVGGAWDLARRGAKVVATFELAQIFAERGAEVLPMNLGGSLALPFGRVKLVPAFHSSSVETGSGIRYAGMPGGFLLFAEGKTVYHAGDTALFGDMRIIGELTPPDVAFLPIGDTYTMGPEDAVLAARWLRARRVVPIHYNTFPAIAQDPEAFVARLAAEGILGIALTPGGSLTL